MATLLKELNKKGAVTWWGGLFILNAAASWLMDIPMWLIPGYMVLYTVAALAIDTVMNRKP